ncbi:MAG: aspartate kinase [Bacteroidetes bacterium]|nr:aspartate kinase [Bacteroidota bacterium]
MRVFKFGGASVKDAAAVANVASVLKKFAGEKIIVVVSAMGKTTNGLEKVVQSYYYKKCDTQKALEEVKRFHLNIMNLLFRDTDHSVYREVNNFFVEADWVIEEEQNHGYNFTYDQIVSLGELISTKIVSAYLNDEGIKCKWIDVRDCIRTDNTYREGKVLWDESLALAEQNLKPLFNEYNIILTQGFIGGTSENYTTTLGREGSDYTAAILAHLMDATDVTIWKDVSGVLNADPKFYKDAQKLEQLSYLDAIELAYYGATVIHPKTIKPLENKNISLYVKSFVNADAAGTVIKTNVQTKPLIPSFIFKTNQVLISISAKDFSFISEDNLSNIFGAFAKAGVKINLTQNSAISFSVCVDDDEFKIPALIEQLQKDYKVLYNKELQLHTVRHYYPSTIESITAGKEILVEQRSRHTAQFVLRDIFK